MSMVRFSPIALNFGYDFVLLVHLFGMYLYVFGYTLYVHNPIITFIVIIDASYVARG